MIGTFLAVAFAKTESQPSEFSGATTSSCTPESSICSTSLICLLNCEFAFVVVRFAMPSLAASSLMDFVSAMRNGLASFSDWEKPTFAVLRSILVPPYWPRVQVAPPGAADATTWAPAPGAAPLVAVSPSSDFAQALRSSRAAPRVAAAGRQRPGVGLMTGLLTSGDKIDGGDSLETHSLTIELFLSR